MALANLFEIDLKGYFLSMKNMILQWLYFVFILQLFVNTILSFSVIKSPSPFRAHIHKLDQRANKCLRMTSEASINQGMLDKVLKVAVDASKRAGDIILGNAGGAEVTQNKANSRDLLTMIDPLCEKVSTIIIRRVECNNSESRQIIVSNRRKIPFIVRMIHQRLYETQYWHRSLIMTF